MYRLFLSLLLTIVAFTTSYAQVQAESQPFKWANTIEISTSLSDEELFTSVGKYLVSEGFDIESSNKDLGQIVTVPRDNGKLLSYYHQYRLSIVNHKVRIRAFFGADKQKVEMENAYTKNSRFWPLLENVADGVRNNLNNTTSKYLKL